MPLIEMHNFKNSVTQKQVADNDENQTSEQSLPINRVRFHDYRVVDGSSGS